MWVWMVAMDGRLGVGDLTADVDASFGDILSGSDSLFAFSGRAEFGCGPIAGYVDAAYSKLGADDLSGPGGLVNADITTEMAFIDFGVMWRVHEAPSCLASPENRRWLSVDLYGGGRYTWLDVEITPEAAPARSRSVDWLDPIVGAKVRIPFGDRWHAAINGDIGGFGAGSDFTWSATAVIGYDFHIGRWPSTAYLGYRALGQDYSTGSGPDRFLWDIIQHGPILGLSLSF